MLALLPACAHTGAGSADRSHSPSTPPSIAGAADTSQLYVPSNVEGMWVFEVRPATPEADRQVGYFGRRDFITQFDDMRRQACSRGLLLVVVTSAAGGVRVPDDIAFNGKLTRVRFFHAGHAWEGAEIPC